MSPRVIGERVRRSEDRRLVSGRGRFIDDIDPPGCVHAAFVRSEQAHAEISGVDVADALDVPGLVAVYTYEDLGALDRPLPLVIPDPGLHHPRTQRPLASSEVHTVGEPIAMVVATGRAAAEDAAGRIRVEYEPLPVAPTLRVAAEGEALAHGDVPGNLAGELGFENGDPDAAFDSAPHVVSRRLWVERGAAMPMETRGLVASLDQSSGHLTVWDTTQSPNTIRVGLARLLELEQHAVDVIAPDIGGGFGVKIGYWYPEEVLVPFACMRLGRPVKWIEDRREHFVGSNHERAQRHDARLALDDDGTILAFEDSFLHEAGAYVPSGQVVALVTASRLPSVYRIPSLRIEAKAVYTNAVPTSPYRGAGQPEATFVMERMLDAAAAELGLDRIELRRHNLLEPGDYPYEPGTGDEDGLPTRYDSGNPPEVFRTALELVRADELEQDRRQAGDRGMQFGFGLGCYVESSGGALYEGARVAVQPSGRVLVATGSSSQGQSHETVLAQVAAEGLGVAVEDVDVVAGDTRQFEHGTGTFGSRIGVIAGNAVATAAARVRDKAIRLAAQALAATPEDLSVEGGVVTAAGAPGKRIALGELAALADPARAAAGEPPPTTEEPAAQSENTFEQVEEPGLAASAFYWPARPVYANGCHAAVVQVDPDTFEIEILRYAAVRDCGREMNPTVVDGQILGGIAQGIGGAFYEKMHYDESGQLVNASFMDYLIPYSTEVPEVALGSVETLSPANPLGVKGTGQGGVMPVAAVIVGALEDALGVPLHESPLSPSRLFELVGERAAG
jgi:aerobic carbon-monoxide dehydrogenase large subunit